MNNFPSIFESIKDLDKHSVERLLSLAYKFKEFSNDWQGLPRPFINPPIISTLFFENSTRTKHSFIIAIKKLGATYIDFNVDTSSLKKGENLKETLITLQCQGVDLCIIRTSGSHQLEEFKENPPVKIINGGDGINQHPTQALTDLFTLKDIGLEFEGKTMAIIGDCLHSRVTNSLLDLMPMFNINIILCGPDNFLPKDINNKSVEITTDLNYATKNSDFLYLLRIQRERHNKELIDINNYQSEYGISLDKINNTKKPLAIFHPGPANIGVEVEEDVIKSPYYFGYQQVKNSIFIRMAIIQSILQNADKFIGTRFNKHNYKDLEQWITKH